MVVASNQIGRISRVLSAAVREPRVSLPVRVLAVAGVACIADTVMVLCIGSGLNTGTLLPGVLGVML